MLLTLNIRFESYPLCYEKHIFNLLPKMDGDKL